MHREEGQRLLSSGSHHLRTRRMFLELILSTMRHYWLGKNPRFHQPWAPSTVAGFLLVGGRLPSSGSAPVRYLGSSGHNNVIGALSMKGGAKKWLATRKKGTRMKRAFIIPFVLASLLAGGCLGQAADMIETGGLTQQEADTQLVWITDQSEYSDYKKLSPLILARGSGGFNSEWVTCLVNEADSSSLLVFIDEHTRQHRMISQPYFPGSAMEIECFLSQGFVFGKIRRTYKDVTLPELFSCRSGTDCIDCMSLGPLFWRFFHKSTGDECFLNRKFSVISAPDARQAYFRFVDSIQVLED